jgi:hypothetical protein
MNPKETVFSSKDLLHSIMDFLPDKEPIWARVVSVSWAIGMCGYKLPNMTFVPHSKKHDEFCDRTTLIPSFILMDPGYPVYSSNLVQKIYFSSPVNCLIGISPDCFIGFPKLFELEIHFPSIPFKLCDFPASLKRLKIRDYGAIPTPRGHAFDGSNLLSLISLDLAGLDYILQTSILPPNIERLFMPRKCNSFSLTEPFPASLKTLVYQRVVGELLPGVLPEGLEHLEIFAGFVGNTGELILPPNITYLDLGKDFCGSTYSSPHRSAQTS